MVRECVYTVLVDWEKDVHGIDSLTAEQRKRMTLSRETLEGIRITSKIIITHAVHV